MDDPDDKNKRICWCPACKGHKGSTRAWSRRNPPGTSYAPPNSIPLVPFADWIAPGSQNHAGPSNMLHQHASASNIPTAAADLGPPAKRARVQSPVPGEPEINRDEQENNMDIRDNFVEQPNHNFHPASPIPGLFEQNADYGDAQNDAFDPDNLDALNAADEAQEQAQALRDAAAAPPVDLPIDDDGIPDPPPSSVKEIQITQQFIADIRNATLDNGGLPPSVIEALRNPATERPDISNPDLRLALDLFLAVGNASEQIYTDIRAAILLRHPKTSLLSYHEVKQEVANLTGIFPIYDDMCINSCHAYTGPFSALEACNYCGEARYDPVVLNTTGKKVPRQQQCTLPLGPQIQTLRRSEEGAKEMGYRDRKTAEVEGMIQGLDPAKKGDDMVYDDIFCGSEYRALLHRLKLTKHDIVASGSADGAQLYQNKKSDTWFSIHLLHEIKPTMRYKKTRVLVDTTIPGPNKPKNLASFMYRSLHHISALQRENNGQGLRCWDASEQQVVNSRIIAGLKLADAVGLPGYDGRVGHHGAHGCRIGCDIHGRHKDGSGHYYQAHSRPNDASNPDSTHSDINIRRLNPVTSAKYRENLALINTATDENYEARRKATGISQPSILDGLHPDLCIPLPMCFTVDLMHMILNLGDLFIKLWRGQLKCEETDDKKSWDWVTLVGDTWKQHGKLVADATPYFPSSFHRPPRNPAEKINSGFKTTEYDLYLFGLGPTVFRTVLPKKYWMNFCKLSKGFRILVQRLITGLQIKTAHTLIIQFVEEYEALYYQRRMDRIHFCRPVVHTLTHLAPEATRVGPGAYTTQFTMERTIGDLGSEVKQPSNPYANLAKRTVRRAQVNALKAMHPELDKTATPRNPKGSFDVGGGYLHLRKRSKHPELLTGRELNKVEEVFGLRKLTKWGRLRLPNQQTIRSLWVEKPRAKSKSRISRMVKIKWDMRIRYAEVRFFFLRKSDPNNDEEPLVSYALVSLFGEPNAELLKDSSDALWTSTLSGDADLQIIKTSDILTCVSMQPLPIFPHEVHLRDYWYVVEKSGLGDAELTGAAEPADPVDEDNDNPDNI
ncbi:hypothetical protein C8J56DRAFT_1172215 [Mycena floridula]|nr:hypothetical protein C8J56DRAFT_1172215 [Mycena floridula]